MESEHLVLAEGLVTRPEPSQVETAATVAITALGAEEAELQPMVPTAEPVAMAETAS
jgi:hypothetical protein